MCELTRARVHVCACSRRESQSRKCSHDVVMRQMAQQLAGLEVSNLDEIAGLLMTMHMQSEELLFQSAQVKKVVASSLEHFMLSASSAAKAAADAGEDKKGDMGISKLGLRLRDGRFRPAGEAVVRGYEAFQGYLTALFNRKTEAQDISYVTSNIKVDKDRLDLGRINSLYDRFDARYKNEIKRCLDEGLGNAYLVPLIRRKVDELRIRHQPGAMVWSSEMKQSVPDIAALIFAVWTLHHSQKFLKAMDASDKQAYLFQPHPVQVVAIFCLLGIEQGEVGLGRSLIQVRTGEGKSAVLGVSAAVLALFKCRVRSTPHVSVRACIDTLLKGGGISPCMR